MNNLQNIFLSLFTSDRTLALIRALIILVAGWVLARLASAAATRLLEKHTNAQQAMLVRRISYYGIVTLTLVSVMHELGFQLGVLLGAASILTVAIGFASQTSASNLISGLFLIAEKPFVVGDVIKIGNTIGEVLTVDLLSVKLRTLDNLYVRIPNETTVKSELTNFSHFPIRRVDIQLNVAYKEDVSAVRALLHDLAAQHTLCLDEPKPMFAFQGFGDTAMNLQFSVWVTREHYLELKNDLYDAIKLAFAAKGIDMPSPAHIAAYAGTPDSHSS